MFIVHIIQQLKLFHHFPKKCSNNLVRATVTCLPPPKLLSWKLVLGLFLLLLIQFHPQNHSLTYNYFYLYLYYFFIVRLGEENNFLDITDLYYYNIANITNDNGQINYSWQLNVRFYYKLKLLLFLMSYRLNILLFHYGVVLRNLVGYCSNLWNFERGRRPQSGCEN